MDTKDFVIGTFDSPDGVGVALEEFRRRGWGDDSISVITRGNEEDLHGLSFIQHDDRTERSAVIGGAAGAAIGLLAGSSLFILPGLGPVFIGGAMASGITGGLVGGLIGAMGGWGIKDDLVRKYERALREGKTLVVLAGGPAALADGQQVLAVHADHIDINAETADSDRVDA